MTQHKYNDSDRNAVYRVIEERRDMRHFLPDPVSPSLLSRILHAAHNAPSVGYMQPWRFIRITDSDIRRHIHAQVEAERIQTAKALNEREDEFMRLKVEGILDCGEVLVVSLMPDREQHIFGRRTMPEMDVASTACAIQNMWLAARAEGLGMGWVSLFAPEQLAQLLNMPDDSSPIAILCIGHVKEFYPKPMLTIENWAKKAQLNDHIYDNSWGETSSFWETILANGQASETSE